MHIDAIIKYNVDKYDDSVAIAKEIIKIREELGMETTDQLILLSDNYNRLKKKDLAIQCLTKALSIRKKLKFP